MVSGLEHELVDAELLVDAHARDAVVGVAGDHRAARRELLHVAPAKARGSGRATAGVFGGCGNVSSQRSTWEW